MDIFLYITISIIYLIFLLVLKNLVFGEKYKITIVIIAPGTREPLERIRRKNWDYFVNYITFQIYDLKDISVLNVWEGRRWDKKFKSKF